MGSFHETIALDILSPETSITKMPIEEMGTQAVQTLIENIKEADFEFKGIVIRNQLIN